MAAIDMLNFIRISNARKECCIYNDVSHLATKFDSNNHYSF